MSEELDEFKQFEYLKPQGDYVICRMVRFQLQGGLILQGQGKADEFSRWQIVAVGPGRVLNDGTRLPMPFKPGDWVLPPVMENPATHQNQFTVPVYPIGEPWNRKMPMVVIHAQDLLMAVEGGFKDFGIVEVKGNEASDIVVAKAVDPRLEKAARKALVH